MKSTSFSIPNQSLMWNWFRTSIVQVIGSPLSVGRCENIKTCAHSVHTHPRTHTPTVPCMRSPKPHHHSMDESTKRAVFEFYPYCISNARPFSGTAYRCNGWHPCSSTTHGRASWRGGSRSCTPQYTQWRCLPTIQRTRAITRRRRRCSQSLWLMWMCSPRQMLCGERKMSITLGRNRIVHQCGTVRFLIRFVSNRAIARLSIVIFGCNSAKHLEIVHRSYSIYVWRGRQLRFVCLRLNADALTDRFS